MITTTSPITISPYEIITVLSNILLMLYITYQSLIYFITGSFCLSIPFTYFSHSLPNSSLVTTSSLYLFLFLFCLFHFKWNHIVFAFSVLLSAEVAHVSQFWLMTYKGNCLGPLESFVLLDEELEHWERDSVDWLRTGC